MSEREFHLNTVCETGPPSKGVDLQGHEDIANKSRLADRISQRPRSCEWVGDWLRRGATENAILTFNHVPDDFNGISAIVVGFWAGANHSVTIRNVPFTK